jgi:uncharacterized membrane protein
MSSAEPDILTQLRDWARARGATPPPLEPEASTFAEKCADAVATVVGSWRFVIIQTTLLVAWLVFNSLSGARVDPYPFILLNLLLSFQAAYTAPIIMMSQNRQGDLDRRRAVDDYAVNRKAELEIETLHQKIDLLRETEIAELCTAVAKLTALLEKREQ